MMMMDELLSCHKVQGTARTRNSNMCHAVMSLQWIRLKLKDRAKSSVFSLLRKTGSVGDPRTDCGRLFQTDAAADVNARSPMVARAVRGVTSADVLDERRRRRALKSETVYVCVLCVRIVLRGVECVDRRRSGNVDSVRSL